MNQPLDEFDSLIARARSAKPPAVDVTARVMESIRQRDVSPLADKPSLAVVAAAVAAASVAVAMAWQSWEQVNNPLVDVFRPPEYVMIK